jgi:hypothetical protein
VHALEWGNKVKFIKHFLHLIVMLLVIVLFPLAFFLQILYGEGAPTSNEFNVFVGLSIVIVLLSLAKRFLGGTDTMNFICFYSFLFTIFWVVVLVDTLKYEREQMLDFIRIIGFSTALVSTLINLKINQLTIGNRPNSTN